MKNTLWLIKSFQKYFIAHQYMPKIFHDPEKALRTLPSYHSHKNRKDSLETRAVFSSVLILT